MSEIEKRILKYLSSIGMNYIARDKDGALCGYVKKPKKIKTSWWFDEGEDYTFYPLHAMENNKEFKFIKFEDENPVLIKELI